MRLLRLSLHVFVFSLLFYITSHSPAHAFGLKTHVWIGQKVLAEVRESCRVRIDGISVPINGEVCDSIRAHPGAFMAGVLGPDAYPDLITGQVTVHPGIANDWQTSDWLVHLYSTTQPGSELAFAAGYLVHAASDSFAHTYVNAYAGDIFALKDERRVALRHFLLEKYIDSRLPGYAFDPNTLAPPADWLRDKLIHNADASRLAGRSGIALHIKAMNNIYRTVDKLADDLDRIEEDAAKMLLTVPLEIAQAGLKLATGETSLALASATLGAAEKALKAEQAVFDVANRTLQDAVTLLQQNVDKINHLGHEARLAREAAEFAKKAGNDAVDDLNRLHSRLLDLERQIHGVPQHVAREICRDEIVDNICGIFCPFCGKVCKDVTRSVCRVVQEVTGAWAHLNDQIIGTRAKIADLQAQAAKAGIDFAANLEIERAKLQEQASEKLLTEGLNAARIAAQVVYDAKKLTLDHQIAVTNQARQAVDHLKAEIAALRERILDLAGVKDALVDLLARADVLSGLAKNWRGGMRTAGSEFIVASNVVAKGMLNNTGNFASTYIDWWKCAGNAYSAVPIQFGQAICGVENLLLRLEEEATKIVERTLPPPFNQLYAEYVDIRKRVTQEVKNASGDAAIALMKLSAPDETTGNFIELLARPEGASRGMMNDAFASAADSSKPLLLFGQVSDMIDADIGLSGGSLNPEVFAPLHNALALSKVALMDVAGVRKLAWVWGADADRILAPDAPGRASLLFDMLRSIDGNHQWQPFGLPYASVGGVAHRPVDPMERRYGYGPGQERPGFQLFVDESLRAPVFLRLFKGPLAPAMASHLVAYPFLECDRHPFAVAFNADGSAASSDVMCASGASDLAKRRPFEWLRRVFNWLRLNPAGT
jgi:hypothetical protein